MKAKLKDTVEKRRLLSIYTTFIHTQTYSTLHTYIHTVQSTHTDAVEVYIRCVATVCYKAIHPRAIYKGDQGA